MENLSSAAIQDLLELASKVNAQEYPSAEAIEALADNSDAFAPWFPSHNGELDISLENPQRDLLLDLEQRHAQVLKKAELLLEKTSDTLKKMKVRGKTILAYTDSLPKRISLYKQRKG